LAERKVAKMVEPKAELLVDQRAVQKVDSTAAVTVAN